MLAGRPTRQPMVVETTAVKRGGWVDGVGDEVLLGGCILSVSVALLAACLLPTRRRARNVHPEQEDSVMAARRELVGEREPDMGRRGEGIGRRGGVGESAEPENCPICLSPLVLPVDTNCGHTFCAHCVLSYWQHDQWPRAARCAICRSPVTLLLPCSALSSSVNSDLWRRVVDYNQRMSGQPRPLLHYLYDVPVIAGHMWRQLFTVQGIVLLHRTHVLLLLLLLLLYLLSPLDLIPEAVFGLLGLVDDLVILAAVVGYATLLYRNYITHI